MNVMRFSAVKLFGLPIERPFTEPGTGSMLSLFGRYDIEPEKLPSDVTDITPYYWTKPEFKYFVSRPDADGPAIVELLPVHADSDNIMIGRVGSSIVGIAGVRTIVVPTQDEAVVIAGGSPRFRDQICAHELILDLDKYPQT